MTEHPQPEPLASVCGSIVEARGHYDMYWLMWAARPADEPPISGAWAIEPAIQCRLTTGAPRRWRQFNIVTVTSITLIPSLTASDGWSHNSTNSTTAITRPTCRARASSHDQTPRQPAAGLAAVCGRPRLDGRRVRRPRRPRRQRSPACPRPVRGRRAPSSRPRPEAVRRFR